LAFRSGLQDQRLDQPRLAAIFMVVLAIPHELRDRAEMFSAPRDRKLHDW
jgi:hypothetical protein